MDTSALAGYIDDRLHPTLVAVPRGAEAIRVPPTLLGLRGINNLGSTCFMNCILQIFLHCPPVARFFLSDRHNCMSCSANRRNQDWPDENERPCLACEMDRMFSQFFSGDAQTPYNPHAFLHAMWCSAEHFAGYEQQDAHEFLIAMLAGICAGIRKALPPPTGQMPVGDADAPSDGWCPVGPHSPRSVLNPASSSDLRSIFSGVLRSEVSCVHCGHTSTKYEDFHDISLDVTRGAIDTSSWATCDSLASCLHSFTRKERLGPAERCWCTQCGALQDSSKQLSFQRLPNVLCFHLKRFKQSPVSKQVSKIDAFIEFPLQSLNMYQHTSANVCSQPSAGGVTTVPPAAAPAYLFDLFGAAVHHGGMQNGHYTSFVRRQADWFQCDDAQVTHTSAKVVQSSKAYLLFYIRKALT